MSRTGLDWLLKPVLGYWHDLVVGTKEQYIAKPGKLPEGYKNNFKIHIVDAAHGKALNRKDVLKQIKQFL